MKKKYFSLTALDNNHVGTICATNDDDFNRLFIEACESHFDEDVIIVARNPLTMVDFEQRIGGVSITVFGVDENFKKDYITVQPTWLYE